MKAQRDALRTGISSAAVGLGFFLRFFDRTPDEFYRLAACMGFASGYWAVLLSSTAEQFGTNIRSTVTSTVPNFIRGTVIPMSSLFLWLANATSLLTSAAAVSFACLALAGFAVYRSRETFGADLDFIEEPAPTDAILFFDGVCNLCNRSVDLLVRRNARRQANPLRFASLQGQAARELLPEALRGTPPDSIVLLEGGRTSTHSQAALRVLVLGGGALGFMGLVLQSIPQPLRDWVYRGVARRRYQWFGKRLTCRLPTKDERAWFFD